ncbi:signal peptidase II [Klebsiella pneumoniae]
MRSADGADVPFEATQKLNNIAYALIIGGALGNLFDRLWHGFVVDMIGLLRRRLAFCHLQPRR